MSDLIIIIGGVAAALLLLIVTQIRIVPQSKAWVMERIGVYSRTWHTGLHIKVPFIERASKKVDLREQILVCGEGFNHRQYHNHADERRTVVGGVDGNVREVGVANSTINGAMDATTKNVSAVGNRVADRNKDFDAEYNHSFRRYGHDAFNHSKKSQPVITKDNVSMDIDSVVFYQVTDPKLFAYGHANPIKAIEQLVATTLRNIIGGLTLDETLTSRDTVNNKMRTVLDAATDAWGIKITRVELRNIIISDVELAEAMEKQMIAERTRRAQVIAAEGEKKAKTLVAEGNKQSEILEAQGKAEAIRLVNEAAPSQEFLTIRALEAFEKAANGESNTIIVPSEIQNLAGLAKSAAEIFKAE